MSPIRAWAPKGKRAHDKKPAQRGSNISTIGALKNSGMQALYPYDGSIDSSRFNDFLENHLKPYLNNNDVVIVDNVSVHHSLLVREKMKELSIKYLYLPPYSPELNPIEESFSVAKHILRKNKARNIVDYVDGIKQAKMAITPSKAQGFFDHAKSFERLG